jgi:hypothetical protein
MTWYLQRQGQLWAGENSTTTRVNLKKQRALPILIISRVVTSFVTDGIYPSAVSYRCLAVGEALREAGALQIPKRLKAQTQQVNQMRQVQALMGSEEHQKL